MTIPETARSSTCERRLGKLAIIAIPLLVLCGVVIGAATSIAGIHAAGNSLQKTADTVAITKAQSICDAGLKQTGAVFQEFSIVSDDGQPRITSMMKTAASDGAGSTAGQSGETPAVGVTVQLQQSYEIMGGALFGYAQVKLAARAEARTIEVDASCRASLAAVPSALRPLASQSPLQYQPPTYAKLAD